MARGDVQAQLRSFLGSARRWWQLRLLVRGTFTGLVLAALAILALGLADALGVMPAGRLSAARWVPLFSLFAPLFTALVRALRHAPDDRSLALRLEEADPSLGHLPSVLLELDPGHPYAPRLSETGGAGLARRRPSELAGRWVRGWQAGVGSVALGAAAVLVVSLGGAGELWSRWSVASPAQGRIALSERAAASSSEEVPPDPLANIIVRVTPPPYTGLDAFEASASATVTALAGSRVEVSGVGPGEGSLRLQLLRADEDPERLSSDRVDGDRLGGERPRAEGARGEDPSPWSASWTLDVRDRGVLISAEWADGERQRVIALAPLPDDPPRVELIEPRVDMVLATGTGEVTFRARASDPFGIEAFELSWVHTRGSGESFDFREGAAAWSEIRETEGGLEGSVTLRLEDLDLGPGQVLHLRAVATDRNTETGPGRGVSQTRQLRVIREGDEMEVDVLIGLPLEAEREPVLSQRMILLMTEDLLTRAGDLDPDAFLDEAYRIAGEQERLRVRVAEQIYSRATGAMEPEDRHLGEASHAPGDRGPAAHGPADHEPGEGAGGEAETRRGSRYGVAAIFDLAVPDGAGPDAPGPDTLPAGLPFIRPGEAGTDVGSFTVGGPGAMPTGFGVLEELGHDHDGDPILSVSQPLLEIHDAMWESERRLRQVDPDRAVPHQVHAMEGLQALRENQRVFPRGPVAAPPVDLVGARGTGELDGAVPVARSQAPGLPGSWRWVAELERALAQEGGAESEGELTRLAVALLGDASIPREVGALVAEAANGASGRDSEASSRLLGEALELLDPRPRRAEGTTWIPASSSPLAAALAPSAPSAPEGSGARPGGRVSGGEHVPFEFATLRYGSGNWDSAPLVPQNLIHALAQYTDLALAPEGVVVDLESPEVFRHPVLYLTGHLPVRFSAAEARNLRMYVERGGFVFMDDHNHDIDGAFHRTATAELARIFGEDALEPLPQDHELYRSFFHFEDGPPTTSHELSGWGDGLIHPELHAISIGGRIGVLYSNKDYSSEWSYHAANKRFLAVDNTRFGVNILIYALTR